MIRRRVACELATASRSVVSWFISINNVRLCSWPYWIAAASFCWKAGLLIVDSSGSDLIWSYNGNQSTLPSATASNAAAEETGSSVAIEPSVEGASPPVSNASNVVWKSSALAPSSSRAFCCSFRPASDLCNSSKDFIVRWESIRCRPARLMLTAS